MTFYSVWWFDGDIAAMSDVTTETDVLMSIAWIHSRVESCSSTSAATFTLKSEDETVKRAKRRAADAQHSVEGKNRHLGHKGGSGLHVTPPEINRDGGGSFRVDLYTSGSPALWVLSPTKTNLLVSVVLGQNMTTVGLGFN